MVRLTSSQHVVSLQAAKWTKPVTLLTLILFATLNARLTLAVTKAQLESISGQIQTLTQGISSGEDQISALEKTLSTLDRQILDTRKAIRDERMASYKQVFDAKRDLKRQEIDIDQIKNDIALVDSDIGVSQRDAKSDQQRYAQLNVFKQSLEESDFKKRQADFKRQLADLEAKKKPLEDKLKKAQDHLNKLRAQVASAEGDVDDSTLNKDPRLNTLLQKRDRMASQLGAMRNQLKDSTTHLASLQDSYKSLSAQFRREQAVARAAATKADDKADDKNSEITADTKLDRTDYPSYVFVVSGKQDPDIEQTLRLKNWVESYGAKYIETSWNGVQGAKGPQSTAGFMAAFRSYLRQIPKSAKIVLIGHGLGGGAAIEAATQVAYKEGRTIDFLAALDPIGAKDLRANIVYDTDGKACSKPDPKDDMTNTDYINCINSAKKRMITSNVRYFYNRWQKDAAGPLDYQREIPSLNTQGKVEEVPTSTGRFAIAENTDSDQKRLFFSGDKNAHELLLSQGAKQLPKLLVQHLR